MIQVAKDMGVPQDLIDNLRITRARKQEEGDEAVEEKKDEEEKQEEQGKGSRLVQPLINFKSSIE